CELNDHPRTSITPTAAATGRRSHLCNILTARAFVRARIRWRPGVALIWLKRLNAQRRRIRCDVCARARPSTCRSSSTDVQDGRLVEVDGKISGRVPVRNRALPVRNAAAQDGSADEQLLRFFNSYIRRDAVLGKNRRGRPLRDQRAAFFDELRKFGQPL